MSHAETSAAAGAGDHSRPTARRWPLWLQILLPMAAVLSATLVVVSVLNAWLATTSSQRRIEEQLRSVARTFENTNFPLGVTVLQQTHGLTGAHFEVATLAGEHLAASDPRFTPPAAETPPQNWQELKLDSQVKVGEERFFHAAVVIDRRPVGGGQQVLHVFYPLQSWIDARNQAIWPPLLTGCSALLLLTVVTAMVAARVTSPLSRLKQQVERIAGGDFHALEPGDRNDELRDLGDSINRMAAMLRKYGQEVRRNERLRALGQLGGGIAHQMRNAATGARMALDLHARDHAVEDDENLEVATRQLTLMEQHLRRFLHTGAPAGDFAPVDLGELVQTVLPLVQPVATHTGIDVRFMPPTEVVPVSGDRGELEQLLINLLLNAIEAAPGGGGQPVVRIELSQLNNAAALHIFDNGPGPADPDAPLFDPLVSEKPDGAGLGLPVSRDIAQQHGGDITWRRVDEETCFRVELPLLQD